MKVVLMRTNTASTTGCRPVSRASQLVLYESKNRMELDALYNEVIVGLSKMEWYQLCKYIWDKKFNFMYVHRHYEALQQHVPQELQLSSTGYGDGREDGRILNVCKYQTNGRVDSERLLQHRHRRRRCPVLPDDGVLQEPLQQDNAVLRAVGV